MKTTDTKSKTGNNATAALADINAQIEALNRQKTTLAEPMKQLHAELRSEILNVEVRIKELDPTWKCPSLRPKADDRIREIITAHGKPMTAEDIIKELANAFSPWKIKNVLKKRSTGAKAVFTLADGKYSVKA